MFPFSSKPLATSTGDLFPRVISIIKLIFIHWIFFPFGITFSSSAPLLSSSEGLIAVLRRAVIIGALLEFANGFRSFGYLQISFVFFLIILGPLPAASDGCNATLFSRLLHSWWRGARWSCLTRTWLTLWRRSRADRNRTRRSRLGWTGMRNGRPIRRS